MNKTIPNNNNSYLEQLDESFMEYAKPYMFIKGFAVGKELSQTLIALSVTKNHLYTHYIIQ